MNANTEAASLLVWPDGSYCWANELEELGRGKSDDYLTFILPEYADDTTADVIATRVQQVGYVTDEELNVILELF